MKKYCKKCSELFEAKRSTAKFCSGKCRTSYHRLSSEVSTLEREIIYRLTKLEMLADWAHLQGDIEQSFDSLIKVIYEKQTNTCNHTQKPLFED